MKVLYQLAFKKRHSNVFKITKDRFYFEGLVTLFCLEVI